MLFDYLLMYICIGVGSFIGYIEMDYNSYNEIDNYNHIEVVLILLMDIVLWPIILFAYLFKSLSD